MTSSCCANILILYLLLELDFKKSSSPTCWNSSDLLTYLQPMFQSHRNQPTDVLSIFIDWFGTWSRNIGSKCVKATRSLGSIAVSESRFRISFQNLVLCILFVCLIRSSKLPKAHLFVDNKTIMISFSYFDSVVMFFLLFTISYISSLFLLLLLRTKTDTSKRIIFLYVYQKLFTIWFIFVQ